MDPPKLIVNDHSTGNFIYTSSPIRKCATTEVFSQKYRVSSFEDMAHHNGHNELKNQVSKKAFRSFEEEQRIESAFTPINSNSSPSNGEALSESSSPIKQHFTSTMTGKERSILWKDSFLKCNKNNLTIKSNESIYEMEADGKKKTSESNQAVTAADDDCEDADEDDDDEDEDEEYIEMSKDDSSVSLTFEMSSNPSSSRHRFSFSLAKFKQNAIIDSIALDTLSESSSQPQQPQHHKIVSHSSSSNDDNTTITSTTNDECNSEEECSSLTESLLPPSHDDVRKFIKAFGDSEENSSSTGSGGGGGGGVGGEEKTPLLEGMELEMLSMSSSTEHE